MLMALQFRYRQVQVGHPVLPLGGRWVRPRPLVWVTAIGPSGSQAERVLIDSGADGTLLPEWIAIRIGIDLATAPTGNLAGFSPQLVPLRYARVTLRLTDGRERHEWEAWVGFTTAPLRYPVLGFAGFLQFFTATLRGDLEDLELTVNRLYPGT
jgi:hypothetical protein